MRNVGWLAVGLLLAGRTALAVDPPVVEWTRTFAGWGTASGHSVQQTADGGCIAVGATFSRDSATRDAAFLVKLDTSGATQWMRTLKAAGGMVGSSVVQTSDGGYVVAGAAGEEGGGHWSACLVRTDSSGNELWRSCLATAVSASAHSVARLGDTGYTVAVKSGLGDSAVILWRTDSGGNYKWSHRYHAHYGFKYTDEGLSLSRASDGGYIIGTRTLLKVDSLGAQPQLKTFGSVVSANSAVQTPDGGYAATGTKRGYSSIYLLKANANRDSVWMRTYAPSEYSEGRWVEQTADGGYIIAGTTRPSNERDRVTLIRTHPDGALMWTATIFGGWGFCVRPTADGGYFVTGVTGGRLFVTKLAAETGEQR